MARQKKRASVSDPSPSAGYPAPPGRSRARRWVVWPAAALGLVAAGVWVMREGRPRSPNVVLITVDTLRADHLGSYGSKGADTPVLDALALKGVRFERAFASIPLTGPSHATILTGLYPPVHGVRDNVVFPLAQSHQTMASILKRQGYRTGGFVSAYPVAGNFGFSEGFDEFSEGFHEAANPGEGAAERPANEAVDAALEWLGK
ncbi:MAG: sulfatase-like hydrolase/transferase, partial [Vicinamibacteria bacterium]|nr:sulfatase-like hydrolase/transferase [Vicinamibacteria bacterium]